MKKVILNSHAAVLKYNQNVSNINARAQHIKILHSQMTPIGGRRPLTYAQPQASQRPQYSAAQPTYTRPMQQYGGWGMPHAPSLSKPTCQHNANMQQQSYTDAAGLQALLNSAGTTPSSAPKPPPSTYGAEYLRNNLPAVPIKAARITENQIFELQKKLGGHAFNAMLSKPRLGPQIKQLENNLKFSLSQMASGSIMANHKAYNDFMRQHNMKELTL